MKILHVTENAPPTHCGVGDFVWNLNRFETGEGVTSKVVSEHGQPAENVIIVGQYFYAELNRIISEFDPDVLNVHIAYSLSKGFRTIAQQVVLPSVITRWFNRRKPRIVITYHQYPDWRIGYLALTSEQRGLADLIRIPADWLMGKVFSVAHHGVDACVVVDQHYVELMGTNQPGFVSLIEVPSNISLDERVNDKDILAFRTKIGMDSGNWIGFFGFLFREKGFEDVLWLLENSNYNLLYVGEIIPDNSYRADMLEKIKNQFSERVLITGYLSERDISIAFRSCGAFVFPFRNGYSTKNGSLRAVQAHGVLAVTTTQDTRVLGYDAVKNTYYTYTGDRQAILNALSECYGVCTNSTGIRESWSGVINEYVSIYKQFERPTSVT